MTLIVPLPKERRITDKFSKKWPFSDGFWTLVAGFWLKNGRMADWLDSGFLLQDSWGLKSDYQNQESSIQNQIVSVYFKSNRGVWTNYQRIG